MDLASKLISPQTAFRHEQKNDQKLMDAARAMEANFMSEMLKAAKFGEPHDIFGGGAGEEQFASVLRQEQAERMVQSGGIGLAESIFQALKEKTDVDD